MRHPTANMDARCHTAAQAAPPRSKEPWSPGLEDSVSRQPARPHSAPASCRTSSRRSVISTTTDVTSAGNAAAIRVAAAQLTESSHSADTLRDISWAGRTGSGAPVSGAGSVVRRTARRARRPPRATPCATRATSNPGAVSTALGRGSPVSDLTASNSRERCAFACPFGNTLQQRCWTWLMRKARCTLRYSVNESRRRRAERLEGQLRARVRPHRPRRRRSVAHPSPGHSCRQRVTVHEEPARRDLAA